jgi:hypothetical protein
MEILTKETEFETFNISFLLMNEFLSDIILLNPNSKKEYL